MVSRKVWATQVYNILHGVPEKVPEKVPQVVGGRGGQGWYRLWTWAHHLDCTAALLKRSGIGYYYHTCVQCTRQCTLYAVHYPKYTSTGNLVLRNLHQVIIIIVCVNEQVERVGKFIIMAAMVERCDCTMATFPASGNRGIQGMCLDLGRESRSGQIYMDD